MNCVNILNSKWFKEKYLELNLKYQQGINLEWQMIKKDLLLAKCVYALVTVQISKHLLAPLGMSMYMSYSFTDA